MKRIENPGRIAGLWYLALVFLGPVRLIYIPNKLFVTGNASATLMNIGAHEQLFRLGIAADLAGAVILVLMSLAFYHLFEGVDRKLAVLVVIFGGIMPALLYFVGIAGDFGVLLFARDTPFLNAFDKVQHDALAMLLLKLRDGLNTAAETLWGVWLLPLGTLVYRSRFLPRFLGVWLWMGGVAYLALSFTGALWPQYQDMVFKISQPLTFAEIALVLWLVVRGAVPPRKDRYESIES